MHLTSIFSYELKRFCFYFYFSISAKGVLVIARVDSNDFCQFLRSHVCTVHFGIAAQFCGDVVVVVVDLGST